MDVYKLDVESPIVGGYLSAEQIDLLNIVECQSIDELMRFVANCGQINRLDDIFSSINGLDLESAKRKVFKSYQDTLTPHDASVETTRINRFKYLGLVDQEEILEVIRGTHPRSKELLAASHHFVGKERDQIKSSDTYEEIELLSRNLSYFNSLLIGSGRIYNVVNKYDVDESTRYDFYFLKRDLDYAFRHDKQVRLHSLLTKEDGRIFEGQDKEGVMEILSNYVARTIDFVREYNSNHKINVNGVMEPQINAIDLFNEIVSFDKDENGEYYNIWQRKYGLTMPELMSCFKYALDNKPKGVSYLYNEPFMENEQRRNKVLETLGQMPEGLIDTIGTQMHITIGQDTEGIRESFEKFKGLQEKGMKVQITEFDMSLGKHDMVRVFGPNPQSNLEREYMKKDIKMQEVSKVIKDSGVKLSGVSYWSLTDHLDHNIERNRTESLKEGSILHGITIPTACGGFFTTHKKMIQKTVEKPQVQQQTTTPVLPSGPNR